MAEFPPRPGPAAAANPAAGAGFRGRICPHFPSKIYRNLAIFSEFFRNSLSPKKPIGFTIIPEPPESARTANAGKCAHRPPRYVSRPLPLRRANAGKCGINPVRGGLVEKPGKGLASGGVVGTTPPRGCPALRGRPSSGQARRPVGQPREERDCAPASSREGGCVHLSVRTPLAPIRRSMGLFFQPPNAREAR